MPNVLAPPNQNALAGYREDPRQYGLPIQNQYGQFEVGGDLSRVGPSGLAGRLDMLYELGPTGDARAIDRGHEAATPTVTPDLMGGAKVGIESPGTVALEYGSAMPAVGDAATLFKMGAMSLPALLALMSRRTDDIVRSAAPQARRIQGTIGSTGAKTADLTALTRAQEMKAAGASTDEIYGQTRWWLDHPDGRPRFEIDDSAARYAPDIYDQNIDKSLSHQELYSAYPDTADIPLTKDFTESLPYRQTPMGSYDKASNTISLRDELGTKRGKSTGLHEVQHAVQDRENMARGGNTYMFSGSNRATNPRFTKHEQEVQRFYHDNPLSSEYVRIRATGDYQKELAESNRLFTQEYNPRIDALEAKIVNRGDYKKYGPAMDQVFKDFEVVKQKQFPLLSRAEKLAKTEGFPREPLQSPTEYLSPHEGYRALAGETEARLVQDRMNMTMPERLADPFYKNFDVPLDEQIVRMEGGNALSNPMAVNRVTPASVADDLPKR